MADGRTKVTKMSRKKRKVKSAKEEEERPSKTHRIGCSQEDRERPREKDVKPEQCDPKMGFEGGGPWRNLQLILSLQSKELDVQKKVELTLEFIKSRKEDVNDIDEGCQTVKSPRLIVFLNDWMQSLLISSVKQLKFGMANLCPEITGTCLDHRCWKIFRFCLEESLKLHVSLNLLRNLLQPIRCVARSMLTLLEDASFVSKEQQFAGKGFEMYSDVLNCLSLVFLSHNGLSNENLDLWISTAGSVLELVIKIYDEKLEVVGAGSFVLGFLCLVFEPFSKFLRIHPTRKNGFYDFVDKLLEPLLHLLGILLLHADGDNTNSTCKSQEMAQEILSQGLFHPIHIDGFLNLRSIEKYVTLDDKECTDSEVVKSYHRHLFDKLGRILAVNKVTSLGGIGVLYRLLVDRVKGQIGATMLSEGMTMKGKAGDSKCLEVDIPNSQHKISSGICSILPEKGCSSSNLNAERRKSLFAFFVQIMNPHLRKITGHIQSGIQLGSQLLDVHCTIKSINSLLLCLMREKIYLRTEDISNGACHNFLRKIYEIILLVATSSLSLSKDAMDNKMQAENLMSIGKEIVLAIGYVLDVEYEVIGNDLVRLWLVMLLFLAMDCSLMDALDRCHMTSEILNLGCQLVKIYSELRQVDNTIYALCKAIRFMVSCDIDSESSYTELLPITTIYHKSFAKSAGMLLCSQEFKLAIHNAFKSIPEGQASDCIQNLRLDISESIEWLVRTPLKNDKLGAGEKSMVDFKMQAELIGGGLSEIYTLVLDSVVVPVGNSNIAVSINDLITVVRPYMSYLVGQQPEMIYKSLFSVANRTSDCKDGRDENELFKYGYSSWWVFVFFLRLYMSCKSLYRQVISLLPPDASKKMSTVMGDSFTAYCGNDWVEKMDWVNEGYFSWIGQPSVSLLLFIQSVSGIYHKDNIVIQKNLKDNIAHRAPLVYVLHAIVLQRLVDLNRHIKASKYLYQRHENLVKINLVHDADLSVYQKRHRKMQRQIEKLEQEASGLAGFIMQYLHLLDKNQQFISVFEDLTLKKMFPQTQCTNDGWDLDVSSVDGKSLPIAIWWIICQNTDIWWSHADKKDLKRFLLLLIKTYIPSPRSNFHEVVNNKTSGFGQLRKVTVHQISSELLSDSIFYEHRFVCSYMASRVCKILEKSKLSLFDHSLHGVASSNLALGWLEVLHALDETSMVILDSQHDICGSFPKPISHSSNVLSLGSTNQENPFSPSSPKFTACQILLNFLCQMPKGCLNPKSFSLYMKLILDIERLIVCNLLDCRGVKCSVHHFGLLSLFMSCRKVLSYLVMEFCENMDEVILSSIISVSEGQFSVLWLFKSVVGLQWILGDNATQFRDVTFSLMDHTSYALITFCKYHCSVALHSLLLAKEPCKGEIDIDPSNEQCDLVESGVCSDSNKDRDAWNNLLLIANILMEQMKSLSLSFEDVVGTQRQMTSVRVVALNKLSSLISSFNGFYWGIVSAINHVGLSSDQKPKFLTGRHEQMLKLKDCINVFADLVRMFLFVFLVEDDSRAKSLFYASPEFESNKHLFGVREFLKKCFGSGVDELSIKQQWNPDDALTCTALLDIDDSSEDASIDMNSKASGLAEIDLYELHLINKPLLQSLLKCCDPEAATLLRQILIAASSILRLKSQLNFTSFPSNLVPICTGISRALLLEWAEMEKVPQSFSFVWLDGVLKYLEELGCHFPSTNPSSSRNMYGKLIELHLKAIGRCISLQGKRATLASHETESSAKIVHEWPEFLKASSFTEPYTLAEFKTRLRMSFKVFIKEPLELHLLSAVQAIERALVGAGDSRASSYEINTGDVEGGRVSSVVAAGIDCLDLLLEHVSGRRRLAVVKRHIHSFIAALFNIVLHLQGPSIFCGKSICNNPDPGAVILMCVEVLTRVAGKHALFQMESWHVNQSLRIPGALLQNLHHHKLPRISASSLDNQESYSKATASLGSVDRKFSIELFAACCRLLYTVIKHHKSACERCIAILQHSVSILLNCLEMVGNKFEFSEGYFSWEVQEGIKFASYLRRIYEELRQQKDFFARHCFKFLSHYIWVYSGHGPLKTGFRREIDEALRPGVYALIDACAVDDLQHLHDVFGEGPCRNTLSTLQHDYKQNFLYEGKV